MRLLCELVQCLLEGLWRLCSHRAGLLFAHERALHPRNLGRTGARGQSNTDERALTMFGGTSVRDLQGVENGARDRKRSWNSNVCSLARAHQTRKKRVGVATLLSASKGSSHWTAPASPGRETLGRAPLRASRNHGTPRRRPRALQL